MPRHPEPDLKLAVIHGPNLNMLGSRDPQQYGTLTLDKLNRQLREKAFELALQLKIYQFNDEGKIITTLHRQRNQVDGIILNPAAFTHYSIAIRDAVELLKIPVVEVHLSNIYEREEFRRISVIKEVCVNQFYGKKADSYLEAMEWIKQYIEKQKHSEGAL